MTGAEGTATREEEAGAARRSTSGDRPPVVLVASTDAMHAGRLAEMLVAGGCRAATSTLETASTRALEGGPEAVVVAAPGHEAAFLVRGLRSRPSTSLIPVIALLDEGTDDDLVAVLDAGAEAVLTRAPTERELQARVNALVSQSRHRSGVRAKERLAREEAEAANRAKDEFLAMVSHELRTPLGAILIWTQLLRREQLDEAATTRALGMIERSTRTLAQLIDDLLDVSRIMAGKLSLESRPVDVAAVVAAAVEQAQPAAQAKSQRIHYHPQRPRPRVWGDASRIQQVVGNLLSNAIKFTPDEGRVDIDLGLHEGQIRLVVKDTGVGIHPEFVPYIFERFRQADSTSTKRQKGLGLGLAIARHLVELHAGTIEAHSAGEGQGTTVIIMLPPHRAAAGQGDDVPREGVVGERRTLDGIRVLVVDDEEDAREALEVLLTQCGGAVTAVGSAPEAIDAFDREQPDVVLSDIAMPGEDGYALIKRIRARPAESGGKVPAAALTAYATTEDRKKATVAGFDDHLAKPIDPSKLVTLVRALARRGRETPPPAS